MAVETVTTMVCDRCGSRHDNSKYMAGSSWGQLSVKWSGDKGGRAYDGAAGGISLKGEAWLCQQCTDGFLGFMARTDGGSGNG